MGYDCGIRCLQCDYEFEASYGIGYMYSDLYAETLKNAFRGKYGVETSKFLWKHPNAAINAAYTMYICNECNNLQNELDLGLYLKKGAQKTQRNRSFQSLGKILRKDNECIDVSSPRSDYQLAKPYKHVCKKCKGVMEELKSDALFQKIERHELRCPQCGYAIEVLPLIGEWD